MKIKESCPCGGTVTAEGDDAGPAVDRWRDRHACDRRAPAAHEQADALVEQPGVRGPVGFAVQPS